jgi:hypothetical protein
MAQVKAGQLGVDFEGGGQLRQQKLLVVVAATALNLG